MFLAISLKSLHVFVVGNVFAFLFWGGKTPPKNNGQQEMSSFLRRDFKLNPSLATIVSLEREKYQSIIIYIGWQCRNYTFHFKTSAFRGELWLLVAYRSSRERDDFTWG